MTWYMTVENIRVKAISQNNLEITVFAPCIFPSPCTVESWKYLSMIVSGLYEKRVRRAGLDGKQRTFLKIFDSSMVEVLLTVDEKKE